MSNNSSRSKNAILNIIFGYLAQIGLLILSFIGRKIFLIFLSVDYLGINGLYSNILTVLSLAELGIDTALVFSLYKPIAEENTPLINALLKYFKKIYYCLAIGIFLIGLAIIPLFHLTSSGFTSGITSGTSGSIRHCELLSTTVTPLDAAIGANLEKY